FLYNLDAIQYEPTMCRATSDGGCIIFGERGAVGSGDYKRMYWLKFNPNTQLSIAEPNESTADINVYPNPAKDMLNIVSSDIIKKIELVNMLGQTVYSSSINSNGMLINTDCLPKGSYIARIHTAQGITTKNVFIE
ncbi:MAG: T9SS type A sorting domain-containing protein, partial [Bacteroidales bacterium]|nr:T9SS type A sorting domain-containing protein [Bacteroidales bacterium]